MAYESLRDEFRYLIDHQDELVAKYGGRVIVLKNLQVIGVYDDVFTAARETAKTEPMGTFLVQKCEAGPDCYTTRISGPRVLMSSAT